MAFVSDLASAFASLNRPGGGGGGGGGGPPEVAGFGPEQRKAETNIGDNSKQTKRKLNAMKKVLNFVLFMEYLSYTGETGLRLCPRLTSYSDIVLKKNQIQILL